MTATTDATEHPLIFYEWSIRRILAGEKTQTRRIVKLQLDDIVESIRHVKGHFWQANEMSSEADRTLWQEKCPYGQPGDVLWVREAFQLPEKCDHLSPREYVEDTSLYAIRYEAKQPYDQQYGGYTWGAKRPSILMPRELCRLRLRVEDVRVERVQEISDSDVFAEGIEYSSWYGCGGGGLDIWYEFPDRAFEHLWNDIYGDGAWDRNDWVWVIEFSRID